MPNRFIENQNAPIDKFGPCPKCGATLSKIVWGWHGVYYDVVCSDGHLWTYQFPRPSRETTLELAIEALVAQADRVSEKASYDVAGIRKCDICKGTAHSDKCELGNMERLVASFKVMGLLPKKESAPEKRKG